MNRGVTSYYGWVIAFTGLSIGISAIGFARFGYTIGISAIGFARFGYTMILPSMKAGLNLTYTQAGQLATANLFGYSLFTLLSGLILARYSARKLISLSLFILSLSLIFTGFSNSFETALVFRFITGLGSGGCNVPRLVLNTFWFDRRRRGLASGIMMAGDGIGLVLGGVIVPMTLKTFGGEGWRQSWFTLGALSLVTVAFSYLLIRDRPSEKGLKPPMEEDVSEASTEAGRPRGMDGNPFKDLLLYRLGLLYLIFGFAYIVYATFFTTYLEKEIGLTTEHASQIWSIVGVMSIVSGFIWGGVSDRFGRDRGLAMVFVSIALSFLLLVGPIGVMGFLASAALFGICLLATPTIMAAATGDYFGLKHASSTLAFITTIFLGLGQIVGPWVAGCIADSTGSFISVFEVSGLILLLGSLLTLRVRNRMV